MNEIEAALDQIHANAKRAFAAKDLDRYMAIFSPGLAYKQLNGKIISREQLRKDIATQFARLAKTESTFTRERIEYRGSDVVEYLAQDAMAEEGILFIFKRTWKIHRRGIYTWSLDKAGWVISRVEVLEETIR
jgi:hypothetical protein